MGENQYRKQKQEKTATKKGAVSRFIQSVLDGTLLTREKVAGSLPFIFFLAGLSLFFISNTYYAEKQAREIESLRKLNIELRTRHTLTKSELMYLSNQSEVARRLRSKGFVESTVPPRQVKDRNNQRDFLKRIFN
jgi:hypothetical protein